MARIPQWTRESRSPCLRYRNTETEAHAVLHRAPSSYAKKWRGVIVARGYPVWLRGFATRETAVFRAALRDRPAPELRCRECESSEVVVGGSVADGGAVDRWYDFRDCGYEAPSQVVYAAER